MSGDGDVPDNRSTWAANRPVRLKVRQREPANRIEGHQSDGNGGTSATQQRIGISEGRAAQTSIGSDRSTEHFVEVNRSRPTGTVCAKSSWIIQESSTSSVSIFSRSEADQGFGNVGGTWFGPIVQPGETSPGSSRVETVRKTDPIGFGGDAPGPNPIEPGRAEESQVRSRTRVVRIMVTGSARREAIGLIRIIGSI